MKWMVVWLGLLLPVLAQPLELREVRRLDFHHHSPEPFVTAASGVARSHGHYYVVNDDSLYLGQFGLQGQSGRAILLFARQPLPLEKEFRKTRKPDLESLTLVETGQGTALISFGSGSANNRQTGVLIWLDPDGEAVKVTEFDLGPLYDVLHQKLPDLNIEGLAVLGKSLRLVHRGNSARGYNALVDLDLKQVLEAAMKGGSVPAGALQRTLKVELGAVEGTEVPWTFTDLAPLDQKRSVFIAAAEDTDNPYEDGEVLGSAVGILEADGTVSTFRRVRQVLKLEGVDVQRQGNRLELTLVTDPDDATKPARMYRTLLED